MTPRAAPDNDAGEIRLVELRKQCLVITCCNRFQRRGANGRLTHIPTVQTKGNRERTPENRPLVVVGEPDTEVGSIQLNQGINVNVLRVP